MTCFKCACLIQPPARVVQSANQTWTEYDRLDYINKYRRVYSEAKHIFEIGI